MKTLFILLIIALSFSAAFAQEVISSSGTTSKQSDIEISWTLGEPVILTLSNENNMLTQGFHQSSLTVTSINVLANNLQIKVYPNPTTQRVFVDIGLGQNFHYGLHNADGKLLRTNKLESPLNEINLESFANGTYFLKIHNKNHQIQSYKIVKMY